MNEKRIAVCKQGALLGKEERGAIAFLGVPFAKPPVGPLRWREPQEPVSWRGIRPAVQYNAGPLQTVFGPAQETFETTYLSEDCLYLNIWTPEISPAEKLPVYVWFYGGSYQGGRADDPTFNGAHLGWLENGIVRDHGGYAVGFVKGAVNMFTGFEPFKPFKQFKPFRAFPQFPPFKPFNMNMFSRTPLALFLMRGR